MLFDYPVLQVIWWFMVGVVLCVYATTAGFDFGVTLLMPFLKRKAKFAENDEERRVILNTIAPTWDGNQTWLVFGGGALFVVWPAVYAATFSGLYGLMLFILWSFFLRPPGFDYRGKLPNEGWRKAWDWGLFISAFFPVLAFGLGLANLFEGLPIRFDEFSMRVSYNGGFLDLLNVFGIVGALISLFMFLMHGMAFLNRRTEGDLKRYFQRLHGMFSFMFLLMFSIGWLFIAYKINGYELVHHAVKSTEQPFANTVNRGVGLWMAQYQEAPWKWAGPILAYVGVILSLLTARSGKGGLSFWLSGLGVTGAVLTPVFALFPFVIPSSEIATHSLTVWNASSAPYTLMGMFYIVVFFLIVIFAYKFWGYSRVWRHKPTLSVEDVRKHDHSFY